MEERLEELNVTFNRLHNSFIPVNQLPREIMSQIFRLILVDADIGAWRGFTQLRLLVLLTGICQHWRYSAIADAWLWTRIVLRSPSPASIFCLPLFLTRSKGVALDVELGKQAFWFFGPYFEDWMARLAQSANRIHKLAVEFDVSSPTAFAKLWFPLPNAETLNITVAEYHAAALPRLFDGELPKLKELSIERFISWPVDLFVNLTRVTLREMQTPITFNFILEFLTQSPALEELTLQSYGPLRCSAAEKARRLRLDHMRSLTIVNCQAIVLLHTLVLPASANVTIINPFTYPATPNLVSFRIASIMAVIPNEPGNAYRIKYGGKELEVRITRMEFWTRWSNYGAMELSQQHDFFDPQSSTGFAYRSFQHVMFEPVVAQVETFRLVDGWLRPTNYAEPLKRMARLQTLELKWVTYDPIHVLLTSGVWRQLVHLELGLQLENPDHRRWPGMVLAAMEARADAGLPLQKLDLTIAGPGKLPGELEPAKMNKEVYEADLKRYVTHVNVVLVDSCGPL